MVLASVYLLAHRLPDRVTYPAYGVCAVAATSSCWDVLLAGVFFGLLTGGVVSLALLATRRAGRRTALPFWPPLLGGAVLAPALGGPVPLG